MVVTAYQDIDRSSWLHISIIHLTMINRDKTTTQRNHDNIKRPTHNIINNRNREQQYNKGTCDPNQITVSTSLILLPRPTFLCLYEECANQGVGFARKADLQRHVDVRHNRATLQLVPCAVEGCHRIGDRGFTRKDKMIDHVREVHKVDVPKRPNNRSSPSSQSSYSPQ